MQASRMLNEVIRRHRKTLDETADRP
jgi:hypothetical protein